MLKKNKRKIIIKKEKTMKNKFILEFLKYICIYMCIYWYDIKNR